MSRLRQYYLSRRRSAYRPQRKGQQKGAGIGIEKSSGAGVSEATSKGNVRAFFIHASLSPRHDAHKEHGGENRGEKRRCNRAFHHTSLFSKANCQEFEVGAVQLDVLSLPINGIVRDKHVKCPKSGAKILPIVPKGSYEQWSETFIRVRPLPA
jgi:hypothetical protein